ncbi:uncharacterized protein AMSG_10167 [Thecamonas trahens ATCC 50062]|uniref:Exportin-5 C-terminal domain-containing protein n=1 Tax=Thecamonas trahens ATCC 50062 TaxID=461836 RepID=A0A0L0DQ50_THETB|nr:hypothetical protein AMSG_10167 [Thecamonas trahens ATCC 50062]KNC54434.1 hypothetical protein AMSG_10167 [Thecamonas trahens ATCC 50062]|eukprot:XP_013753727.1 hypothetical protein AMSG_10167 [Thecamonas trahens ATCC 50062]
MNVAQSVLCVLDPQTEEAVRRAGEASIEAARSEAGPCLAAGRALLGDHPVGGDGELALTVGGIDFYIRALRSHWGMYPGEVQAEMTREVLGLAAATAAARSGDGHVPAVVEEKVADALVAVSLRHGVESVISDVAELATGNDCASPLGFLALRSLSEAALGVGTAGSGRGWVEPPPRRAVMDAMVSAAEPLASMLVEATSSVASNAAHSARREVVKAGLQAMASVAEWAPLPILFEANFLGLAASLLAEPAVAEHTRAVLENMLVRRRTLRLAEQVPYLAMLECLEAFGGAVDGSRGVESHAEASHARGVAEVLVDLGTLMLEFVASERPPEGLDSAFGPFLEVMVVASAHPAVSVSTEVLPFWCEVVASRVVPKATDELARSDLYATLWHIAAARVRKVGDPELDEGAFGEASRAVGLTTAEWTVAAGRQRSLALRMVRELTRMHRPGAVAFVATFVRETLRGLGEDGYGASPDASFASTWSPVFVTFEALSLLVASVIDEVAQVPAWLANAPTESLADQAAETAAARKAALLPDGVNRFDELYEAKGELLGELDGMLEMLLQLELGELGAPTADPGLMSRHVHMLVAFAPFLREFPDRLSAVLGVLLSYVALDGESGKAALAAAGLSDGAVARYGESLRAASKKASSSLIKLASSLGPVLAEALPGLLEAYQELQALLVMTSHVPDEATKGALLEQVLAPVTSTLDIDGIIVPGLSSGRSLVAAIGLDGSGLDEAGGMLFSEAHGSFRSQLWAFVHLAAAVVKHGSVGTLVAHLVASYLEGLMAFLAAVHGVWDERARVPAPYDAVLGVGPPSARYPELGEAESELVSLRGMLGSARRQAYEALATAFSLHGGRYLASVALPSEVLERCVLASLGALSVQHIKPLLDGFVCPMLGSVSDAVLDELCGSNALVALLASLHSVLAAGWVTAAEGGSGAADVVEVAEARALCDGTRALAHFLGRVAVVAGAGLTRANGYGMHALSGSDRSSSSEPVDAEAVAQKLRASLPPLTARLLFTSEALLSAVAGSALALMSWGDVPSIAEAADVCLRLVPLLATHSELGAALVGTEMLTGAIQALANGVDANAEGLLVNVVANAYMAVGPVAPDRVRSVVVQIPGMDDAGVVAFEETLLATRSEKHLRRLVRQLLSPILGINNAFGRSGSAGAPRRDRSERNERKQAAFVVSKPRRGGDDDRGDDVSVGDSLRALFG